MRLLMNLVVSTLLGVVCAGIEVEALADDAAQAADVAAARSLGQEGVKLAEAGNCRDAVDRLSRAEKLFHAPTTLARLGECQVKLGTLVEGTENLNRVARETLPPGAPTAFIDAQERARTLLAETKPKIARLKIAVAAPPDAHLSVTVDGVQLPLASLNTNRLLDPGEHIVEATAPKFLKATATVRLAEGGSDSVALTLSPDPRAMSTLLAVPADAPLDVQAAAVAQDRTSGPNRVPAYVAWSVGLVGVAAGSALGLAALGKKSELESACPNRICGERQRGALESAQTMGTASSVAFGVGLAGAIVGTYLYVTASSPAGRAAAQGASTTGRVAPWLAGTTLGIRGAF